VEPVELNELGLDPRGAALPAEPEGADPLDELVGDLPFDGVGAVAPGAEAGLPLRLVPSPHLQEGGTGGPAAAADEEAVARGPIELGPSEPGLEDLRGVLHGRSGLERLGG
jgi:hypothetical protein